MASRGKEIMAGSWRCVRLGQKRQRFWRAVCAL
jgi:hypothetical protein